MILSDRDVERIADAVVARLTGEAQQMIDIQREVRMSADERRALSRQRLAAAKQGKDQSRHAHGPA